MLSLLLASDICVERYACYIYTVSLKHLPAIVRKWWTNSKPRQKSLVDRITTAFVTNQLCQDEWRALLEKKDKQDSIALTVHASTREVHATYSIDEARMELIVQLPINYPLGTMKVSCGRQTGDKLQSKQVVMQLSIFLTHQNGSIDDGLSLWKRNLDRKFEGVEECYVCYSVIHQETYQLPKLSCKTCKKKFHGQCLVRTSLRQWVFNHISNLLLLFCIFCSTNGSAHPTSQLVRFAGTFSRLIPMQHYSTVGTGVRAQLDEPTLGHKSQFSYITKMSSNSSDIATVFFLNKIRIF